MALLSGLMAMLRTLPVYPWRVLLTWPDAMSHTLVRVGRFRRQFSLNSKQAAVVRSDSPHCVVVRTRHDGVAIWADGNAVHTIRVPLQRALNHTRRQIPHAASCGKVSEATLV